MQLMAAGDKWELYIPSELGYGQDGSPPDIGPGDALVFTLHLVKLNGPGVPLSAEERRIRGRGRAGLGRRGGKHKGGGQSEDVHDKRGGELRL